MAEPQPRTSQPQHEKQTRNEIKTLDDMKEEVEMNDLTPDADPDQDEEVDSDPELRNLEGECSKCSKKTLKVHSSYGCQTFQC